MQAADIHARVSWPAVLAQLGIPETALRNKHGPCPACGGRDRYRFDGEKRGRGSFICSHCGAGDGFKLLQLVHGWSFSEARQRVIAAAGLAMDAPATPVAAPVRSPAVERPAAATERVLRLRRGRCRLEDCDDAVDYLASRGLWPLPEGCVLAAHAGADYWDEGQRLGRYPALLADVVDEAGELVTVHATYLEGAAKLALTDPSGGPLPARKLLSPLTGRNGCAVRLMAAGASLGIAEGVETALAASLLDQIPVWAALNTSLLARFDPPPQTQRLILYADNDLPGMTAACRLLERLQGRIRDRMTIEVRIPPHPAKDWNDSLLARRNNGERLTR